jgi:hypothetical protein
VNLELIAWDGRRESLGPMLRQVTSINLPHFVRWYESLSDREIRQVMNRITATIAVGPGELYAFAALASIGFGMIACESLRQHERKGAHEQG